MNAIQILGLIEGQAELKHRRRAAMPALTPEEASELLARLRQRKGQP
jgi:hypothetical protein